MRAKPSANHLFKVAQAPDMNGRGDAVESVQEEKRTVGGETVTLLSVLEHFECFITQDPKNLLALYGNRPGGHWATFKMNVAQLVSSGKLTPNS